MPTIHHATRAKATKLGCEFVNAPDGGFMLKNAAGQLSTDSWDDAKEAVTALAAGQVEFAKLSALHCGVMAASYHRRYESNPHGPGCNDGLDCAMRDELTNDDGQLDLQLLRQCGEAAGIWTSDWSKLNPGMQRMNCANRLRALLRNNAEVQVTIGQVTGRFDVAYNPAGRKAKARKAA